MAAVLALAAGAACGARTTPIAPIVLAYDASTADSISRLLLLNIARARHSEPMHFTTLSNIVATYKFTVSGGFVVAVTGDRGFLPVPQLGGTAEENPTLSISPMQVGAGRRTRGWSSPAGRLVEPCGAHVGVGRVPVTIKIVVV